MSADAVSALAAFLAANAVAVDVGAGNADAVRVVDVCCCRYSCT